MYICTMPYTQHYTHTHTHSNTQIYITWIHAPCHTHTTIHTHNTQTVEHAPTQGGSPPSDLGRLADIAIGWDKV
jgi:hypothetical protein